MARERTPAMPAVRCLGARQRNSNARTRMPEYCRAEDLSLESHAHRRLQRRSQGGGEQNHTGRRSPSPAGLPSERADRCQRD